MKFSFSGINNYSSQAEKAFDFYQKLGFPVVTHGEDNQWFGAELSLMGNGGEPLIWIWRQPEGTQINACNHFVFHCESLDALYEDLHQKGLTDKPPYQAVWGGRELMLSDPDGNQLLYLEGGIGMSENLTVDSRCGLHCTGCGWKESHGCGGCIESGGNPFHGECPVARCSIKKELAHCGECDQIPCEQLYQYSYLDKEHGDTPPGARIEQCKRWAGEQH